MQYYDPNRSEKLVSIYSCQRLQNRLRCQIRKMNTVSCPHCGKPVEISEALTHQIQATLKKELEEKHKEDLQSFEKELLEKTEKKIRNELEEKFQTAEENQQKAKEKVDELLLDMKKLHEEKRELENKDKEREIEFLKKLREEQVKLEDTISKRLSERFDFEKQELRKQLDDTKKSLAEAQRKAEQKSQQLQGEILELELEQILKSNFPHDEIVEVGKGVLGADVTQIVKSPRGVECGQILWEFKRAKEWSDKWVVKLKEDMRASKANFAVIVSTVFPKDFPGAFTQKDGVIITEIACAVSVSVLLRKNLLDVGYQKAVALNRGSKAELLYGYVTSHEFQQQIENAVEAYREIMTQVQKERVTYERLWKQREGQAQRIITSLANLVGDMQGRVGNNMPQIKGLELLELSDENDRT